MLCWLLPLVASAQAPQATATSKYTWDFSDANLAAAQVTRFEISVDGGPFTTVGLPAAFVNAQTGPGMMSYSSPVGALTQGNHTFTVRPCNAQLCGDPQLPFAFVFVVKPVTATNLRIVP